MGKGIGSESPFGLGEETAWGTPVAPTAWPRIKSEGMKVAPTFITSKGMQPGIPGSVSVDVGSQRIETGRTAEGNLVLEVQSRGMGLIFKHLLGSTPGVTLTTARQGTTAAYLHTFRLGPNEGKSLTLQKLIRDGAHNVVSKHLYPGSKFATGEFSLDDGLLQLALDITAKDELFAFTTGEPQYPEGGRPFTQMTASLTLGGQPLAERVNNPTLKIENNLAAGGPYLGSGGLISEQTKGKAVVTGGFDADVTDQVTLYNAWRNGTPLAYELYFPGALIESTYREYVKFKIPQIQLLGDTPVIGGPDIVTVPATWQMFIDDAGTPPLTIEYMTRDAVVV